MKNLGSPSEKVSSLSGRGGYAMRIVGRVDDEPTEFDGKWVQQYDPARHLPDGSYDGGLLVVSDNPAHARPFANFTEALEYWKQSYGIRPWDGKPNRPLTAFHVTVERLTATAQRAADSAPHGEPNKC